jgi:hypothetical protein
MLSLITGARAEDRPFHVEANVGRSSVDDIDGLSIEASRDRRLFMAGELHLLEC